MGVYGSKNGSDSDGKVVALADAASGALFPALTALETYWQGLRGPRLVPARSEVDPRAIQDTLEYAFILERIAPGHARFRLAGMHLNDLMGMEVRGMPLTAFFAPDARPRVSQALEQVFDAPAIARLSLSGPRGLGRPALEARLLLMPLRSDLGEVSRALGALVSVGSIGRAPRRFGVAAQEITPIARTDHQGDWRIGGWSRMQSEDPAGPPPAKAPQPRPQEFAEEQAPYSPEPRPIHSPGKPMLYVIDGGAQNVAGQGGAGGSGDRQTPDDETV